MRARITIAVGTAAILWLAPVRPASAQTNTVDGVAAYVNDRVITVSDVMFALQPFQRQLRSMYSGEELKNRQRKAYRDTVEALIDQRLILDVYEKLDAKLPEWVFEERRGEIVDNAFKGDRNELLETLKRDNMTLEQWQKEIRDHVIISFMKNTRIDRNIRISPRSVREAYEKNPAYQREPDQSRLRLILIDRRSVTGTNTVRQAADDARRRLDAGEEFAAVARAVSQDRRAVDGGDWGWVDPTTLRPAIAEVVKEMQPGTTSPVIETPDGCFIVRVEENRPGGSVTLQDAQPRVERDLRMKEAERLYKDWVRNLRAAAYVKVVDTNPFP